MIAEGVSYICTSDISGRLRGKGCPASDLDRTPPRAVGWTPTNVQITCFDTIAESPYGSFGDLVLIPDLSSRARVDFEDDGPIEDFVLGDVRHLDGRPWECCTRSILRGALDRLDRVAGLTLFGAFEHEMHFLNGPKLSGQGFALSGFRAERRYAEALVAALRTAGMQPDTVVREYGPDQFEVTLRPAIGLAIADQAAVLRELARTTAERLGKRVTFAPLIAPGGVGNGVHIHLSFRDARGRPATYDPDEAHGMAPLTGNFIAGILRHLPALVAFTAPSVVSGQRLVPHRWSAAFNNLGAQDREAAVRLCPVRRDGAADPAEQFNFEIRAVDAAASPHLALAAIVHAGVLGIEQRLGAPEVTAEDLSQLSADALQSRGFARLPQLLEQALGHLERDQELRACFPAGFVETYLAHKSDEIACLEGREEAEICAAYQQVY